MKKKFVLMFAVIIPFFFISCFGRFALTRAVYNFNDTLVVTKDAPLLNKFIKTGIMWLYFIAFFVPGIIFLGDLIVFNVIEFWSGINLIDGHGRDQKEQTESKKENSADLRFGGEAVRLAYLENGERMDIIPLNSDARYKLTIYKKLPGKFFVNEIADPGLGQEKFR
ncbi:MAG: DUF3332 domain-containing protein [Leptospira sp.]|nr:DUF3332 domain-containing protein [Leptospira sp.]